MKKYSKKIVIIIVFLIAIALVVIPLKSMLSTKKTVNELININELSDEFMDNYYEEVRDINKSGNEENILLVISNKKVKESYGATKVVEGPNHLYVLEYDTKEKKEEAYSKLKEDDSLLSVEENKTYKIDTTTYNSWGIEAMHLDTAIEVANEKNLPEVTAAIIDTGCDITLANKYYNGKFENHYDVLTKSTTTMTDENGHGTHIAGTIAEGTPNNVKVLPIKVSSSESISLLNIVTAIDYVTSGRKADVINMSFGSYEYSQSIDQAIEAANAENIICVTAAGNDNTSSNHYPSAQDNTISIASVDMYNNKSSFSNYGSSITFAAPGSSINSIMSSEAEI